MIPEIGRTIIPGAAILAFVFLCGDKGDGSKWSAVGDLFSSSPCQAGSAMIYRRWLIQVLYLYVLFLVWYFVFFLANPYPIRERPLETEYGYYAVALAGRFCFGAFNFGYFQCRKEPMDRNRSVGGSLDHHQFQNRRGAVRRYNLFAYSASHPVKGKTADWIFGTMIQIAIAALFVLLIPWIEKRVSK